MFRDKELSHEADGVCGRDFRMDGLSAASELTLGISMNRSKPCLKPRRLYLEAGGTHCEVYHPGENPETFFAVSYICKQEGSTALTEP